MGELPTTAPMTAVTSGLKSLDLPPQFFSEDGVEFHGQVSFLKAGIRYADRLSTVSPRYAQEILTPEFGCGLDGLLRTRADDLGGKHLCKSALQAELHLEPKVSKPLFVFMSRITEQKMADVLPAVTPRIIERGGQAVVMGQGDRTIESALRQMANDYPGQVSVQIHYDEGGAKRMLAGSDVLLAPARFEPCGLTQMYGMRYGALPVARRVGGLADTVTQASDGPTKSPTGFLFEQATAADFSEAIEDAVDTYRDAPSWRRMQRSAMTRDFGWRRSASRYIALYRDMLGIVTSKPAGDTAEPAQLHPIAL